MNKVKIITTTGCEGCAILLNSTLKAIEKHTNPVTLEVTNIDSVPKQIRTEYGLTDFPTMLLFVDNEFKYKHVGSIPVVVVNKIFNKYFGT